MTNRKLIRKWIERRKDVNPKEGQRKYGDVDFADERNKKYPIDTEEHIRAAWNYIHHADNAAKYEAGDVEKIKAKILTAWKSVIGGQPPSAMSKAEYLPTGTNEAIENNKLDIYEAYMFTDLLKDISYLIANQKKEELKEGESVAIRELLEQARSLILQASHLDLLGEASSEGNENGYAVMINGSEVGDFGKIEIVKKSCTNKRDDVPCQDIFKEPKKDPKKIEKEDDEGASDIDMGGEEGTSTEDFGTGDVGEGGEEDIAMCDTEASMKKKARVAKFFDSIAKGGAGSARYPAGSGKNPKKEPNIPRAGGKSYAQQLGEERAQWKKTQEEQEARASEKEPDWNLYDKLKAAGHEMDSHASDLYVKKTPESEKAVKESGLKHSTFISQKDKQPWIEVPFAHTPHWDKVKNK